jgi:hypothetical protein
MKKGIFIVSIVVLLVSIVFSGCQTNSTTTPTRPQNVYLQSTIVEFANVTLEKTINKSGGVSAVTVGWLFHNIAGREISGRIDVRFYDKNNGVLYNTTRWIRFMPSDFTERLFSPGANKATYDGPGTNLVDHIVITVTEI